MHCSRCAADNPKEAHFCRQCGTELATVGRMPTKQKTSDTFFKWVGYIVVFLIVIGILNNW